MGQTTVRSHTRRGYQVRAHTRQTDGRNIADVLARDLARAYEQTDQDRAPGRISGADPDCPHPGWYPIRQHLLDIPYEESPILAYCCTDCAASRRVVDGAQSGS